MNPAPQSPRVGPIDWSCALRRWRARAGVVAAAGAFASMASCGTDDPAALRGPTTGAPTPSATGGGAGAPGWTCSEGTVDDCHITVGTNNGVATCMDGARTCRDGKWSACEGSITERPYSEAAGHEADRAPGAQRGAVRVRGGTNASEQSSKPLSLSTNTGCLNNPCDPTCQIYDEQPMSPVTLTSLPPPGGPYESGSITDLTGNQQQTGLKNPCANDGDCLYDHHCDTASNTCQPWLPGQYATCGGPDLTAGIACMNGSGLNTIALCNRGDAIAQGPIEIAVYNSGNTLDYFACTSAAITSLFTGACVFAGDLQPGECTNVTGCDAYFGGTDTFVVNAPQPPALQPPIAECECKNNWSGYHNGNACSPPACSAIHVAGSIKRVNMFMILDNSWSMSTSNIWSPAKAALTAFYQDDASAGIYASLRFFGNNPVAGCDYTACNPSACAQPQVPLGQLAIGVDPQETALVGALGPAAPSPSVGTPQEAVVAGAMQFLTGYAAANPGEKYAFVYVTDGEPTLYGGCTQPPNWSDISAPAAAAFAGYGIETYPIALFGSNKLNLDILAAAGGTGTSVDLTAVPSALLNAALTAALVSIKQQVVSCDVALPNAGGFDPNVSTATWLPTSGAPVPLTRVNDATSCATSDQYYYDDNANPTQLTLCPGGCTVAQADPLGTIDFAAACPVTYAGSSQYTQVYQGVCPSGKSVQWGFLAYDALTPSDSSIEVAGHTSATNGPFTSPLRSLASVPASHPNACPMTGPAPCPINLFQDLGGIPEATTEYLELVATLNPSSDGTAAPSLNRWEITYSCIDSE